MLPPASGAFPFHPLTDIGRTVLELNAIGFALRQKSNRRAIHERYVAQVQRQVAIEGFQLQEPAQLRDVFHLDSPAQGEDDPRVGRSLDFQHSLENATRRPFVIA